jgi:hypothetical protein
VAVFAPIGSPAPRAAADEASTPAFDIAVVAAFMAVAIASGLAGAAGYDTARDVAQALAIRQSSSWPLHGPMFAGSLHLGPLWFYVLALPLFVHSSWLAVALFVAALSTLQFPLAYAVGRRLRDRRLGLLWCALLALPGWGSFQWVGFAHTNVVPAVVMLVLYMLVRLAQERRPVWLPLAAGALSIAVHAHPTALAYAPLVLLVAAYAIRNVGALVLWGAAAIAVALIPFAPLAFEAAAAQGGLLQQSGDYVEGLVHVRNLANVPALFYAMLERGPRVVTDAFCAWPPGSALGLRVLTFAIEAAAIVGLAVALAWRDRLAWAALALTVLVAAVIAWVRPVTPFYMTYALLPALAGALAVGWHVLLAGKAGVFTSGAVGMVVLLHAATVAGIARTIVSGHVVVPVISRLDVKHDDTEAPLPEPWLAAYAVDRSGALLCGGQRPVVLHGTYAFLEDMYLGLDQRLHCAAREVRLVGAAPAEALHLVGLAKPLWMALGWRAAQPIGGMGVATASRVLHPASGFAVPDGSAYPPHSIAARDERQISVDASVPANEALVVSQPYAAWMPPPRVSVSANGSPVLPLASDAVSAVYWCAKCPAQTPVEWKVGIASVAPERIDVVTLAPPR